MSQPHNQTDTQALLQSMLQRLKLQPGREGQAYLNAPALPPHGGQGGEREASNPQKLNNSPVNGFGTNGIPSKEFGISAADGKFSLKGGELQQQGYEVDGGLVSLPTQKDNIDSDRGENRVLGWATRGITPTRTGQPLPAISLKDADSTSFERTAGERVRFGSSAMTRSSPGNKGAVTSMGQNQDQDRGFTPRVFVWSLKPTDTSLDTGSQEDKALHVGNGGFGALGQSKDMQIVPNSQKTTNSSSRRKQRPSENKTRRWTQKIKERWMDRQGSLHKKGKEEGDKKSEQESQNQLLAAETLINTSNNDEERTFSSLDSSDVSETPPANTEDGANEEQMRSAGDFDFGLGSFSLLEEIVTGQEWAKFLNPGLSSAASADQTPPGEVEIPPNPHDFAQSPVTLNQHGGGKNQWSFTGTEASLVSDVNMAQTSPDGSLPVGMDVSGGKQHQYVHREADQSEPMEHGNTQSDMQSEESRPQHRPTSFVKPADFLENSALKTRVQLSRKRQHQSAERRAERLQTGTLSDGKVADREGFTSSLSQTSSHLMEETGEESRHDNFAPLNTLNSSPLPLSPSSFAPFAPARKGVLKHSISQDSESSVEVMTKRRRVEENRRVRFSEEVQTIPPPELDLDATDSEDDSGAEEDSVLEQEYEAVQEEIEEVAPARRPVLPAWIQALKRRNTGRKPR